MPIPSPSTAQRSKWSDPRWFYVWSSLLMWVLPASIPIVLSQHGDDGIVIFLAAWPVVMLADATEYVWPKQIFGLPSSIVAITVVMGVLGLLQDLLRVPRSKWVIIVYLIVLLLPLLLSK
jgi:hypothetical protein